MLVKRDICFNSVLCDFFFNEILGTNGITDPKNVSWSKGDWNAKQDALSLSY